MFLLLIVSLAGWPLLLGKTAGRTPERMILPSLALVIGALCCLALAGFVSGGIRAVFWAGLAAFAAWVFICSRKRCFGESMTPGFLIFLGCALLARWKFADAHYSKLDEFSHWGFAIKELLAHDRLPLAADALKFKDYPPGATVFHGFAAKIAGYSEGTSYFSQSLLMLGPLAGFINRKNAAVSSLMYCAALALLLVFGYETRTLNSLYADQVIAVWFGMAAALYFTSERETADALAALAALAVLPLIKDAGLPLALAAGAAIAIDAARKNKLIAAALIAAPLLAAWSWLHYQHAHGLQKVFPMPAASPAGLAFWENGALALAFAKKYALQPVGFAIGGPFVSALLWPFLILWAGWRIVPHRRQAVFLAGYAVYSFGLLLVYQRSFSPEEGKYLFSFARYMSIYLLGWALAVLGHAEGEAAPGKRWAYALAFTAACAAILTCETPALTPRRARARGLAGLLAATAPQSRVYVICQGQGQAAFYEYRYELSPHPSNLYNWSLSPDSVAPERWKEALRGYDYALIASADDKFWKDYADVFSGGPEAAKHALFRVSGDGTLRF
ncbi:MAG: hypothetical protein WC421_05820 [Elusimicrobiales bacterium]